MMDYYERIADRFNASNDFTFQASCVMLCMAGSHSHGTYIPPDEPTATDDIDLIAVCLPPSRYVIGLETFEHWSAQWDELDVVVYSFHKFVRLLLKSNPNVLGTLWLRDDDYLVRRPAWARLAEHRSMFATRAAHGSFAGYANGQLARMTSYSPEIQAEIDTLTASLEACGWHLQDVMDGRSVPMPCGGTTTEQANAWADRLRHLRAKYHSAYMGEKRRGLVVRHGYDTKNAAHLVRLLRMCCEFLQTGEMQIFRTADAEELKAIKRGAFALDDVKALAEMSFAAARSLRDSSPLPFEVDFHAVSHLVTAIVEEVYYGSRAEASTSAA